MTLEELLKLAYEQPDNPEGYERYVATRTGVRRSEDLLADDSIEVTTIAGDSDPPEEPVGRSELLRMVEIVEVLEAWSAWRNGKLPSTKQAAAAIMWFVDYDAFIPVERTDSG